MPPSCCVMLSQLPGAALSTFGRYSLSSALGSATLSCIVVCWIDGLYVTCLLALVQATGAALFADTHTSSFSFVQTA